MFDGNAIVYVQREWNAWRTAEVRLRDLKEIHWRQPAGAPQKLVHAYVSCADIRAGDLPHACGDSWGPHRLLVCVLRRHVTPSVHAEIARRADERERRLEFPPVEAPTLVQGLRTPA